MAHLHELFAATVAQHPQRLATRIQEGDEWVSQTYAEFDAAIERTARGLINAGVQRGDRVAMLAANSPLWSQVDLACVRVGAILVPLYPSSTPSQITHIVGHSGATLMFTGTLDDLVKVQEAWASLPSLARAICFQSGSDDDRVQDFADFCIDDEDAGAEVQRRIEAHSDEEDATIIYTSGTTGEPKGVVLQHKAFDAELKALDEMFDIGPEESSICFLPLSHAFERAWTFYVFMHGCLNTYCPDPRKLSTLLPIVKPTMIVNVPRFYEIVMKTAQEKADSPAKKKIFQWAFHVGGRAQRAFRKGKRPPLWIRAQIPLADKLVFSHIRDAMGGPKKVMACGGAPVRAAVEEFFSAAGMLVMPGYGMTEAAPLISFNAPGAFKVGTAGRIMAGGEIKIGADSELLYRGPNVMRGYWRDDAATAAAIDADGWLHTGDAGYVDNQGFVVITDRLKDLLVTSNGKNVAPQPIEGDLLTDPLFEYAVLLGNDRPFLTLLVKPSFPLLEDIAKELQVRWERRDELVNNQQIVEEFKKRVAALTEKLPKHEQIKDLRVLWEEFTTENGLLTPTLKVKRKEVEKRFSHMIEDMYQKFNDLRGKGEK